MLASLVPIVALGWWVADFASSVLEEEIQQSIGRAGDVQAERVNATVVASLGYLGQITNDPSFLRAVDQQGSLDNTTESSRYFQEFVDNQFQLAEGDGLIGLAVFTIGGGEPRLSGDLGTASAFLRTQVADDDVIIGEAFLTEDGDARLPVARRVRGTNDDGSSVTIIAEWSIDRIVDDAIDPATLGDSARSLVAQQNTDGSLTVVAGSDRNLLGQIVSLSSNPVVGEGTVQQTDDPLAGLAPVVQTTTRVPGDPGWVSIIEIDQAEIFSELAAIRTRLITVFIAAGIAVMLVVVFAVRGFVRRLGRVSDLAAAVAAGDLTVRIGDDRHDELGRLSSAFDDMAKALAIDIAHREQIEEELAYQATHDSLTGLPNRSQLVDQLDRILGERDEVVSCLFVDLDGFKAVNDRLGHGAGDELLIRVGERLADVLRPSDFLARLGGDEFVVILRGLGPVASEKLASRIVAALELPFVISDEEVQISASIGVASASDDHTTERLIKEADIGMYRAKAKGRGRAVRVTDETMREVDERVTLLTELRDAVAHDELELTLVPMADLRDGSLRSVEAAARWHHPTRGLVTTEEFEQLVADSGTAQQLDDWMILHSTALLAQWRDDGMPVADIDVAINLSPHGFVGVRSRQLLIEEIARLDLSPANLRIEVSETVLRNDPVTLREVFDTYRAAGISVTIDSFGSDYSNLELLPRYAIDAVKIDLHQIADLTNRLSSRALISSLITLAQTAGLRVTAAGVDDEDARAQMVELGCFWGQGLWFSPPVIEDDFVEVLERRHLLGSF